MRGNVRKIRDGRWLATYYEAGGRRRARSFPRKLDADRFLATTQADQLRGSWIAPEAGLATVAQYAEAWIRTRDVRQTTRDRYVAHLRYVNRLGDVPLSALEPSIMREWLAGLRPALSTATANQVRGMFAAMLDDAVLDGKIVRTPLAGVRRLKADRRPDVVPLERDVVLGIAERIAEHYRAAVVVGIGAGLRRGEAFALCVSCVDFMRRTVRVHADHGGVVDEKRQPLRLGPPKTASSVRVVPVSQHVIDELARHLERFPAGDDGVIFRTRTGALVGEGAFASRWRAVAPAGSRFHDLRHFYASTLIAAGLSVKVVQERLGHATANETLNTYAHLWPGRDDDSTRAALDEVFARRVARLEDSGS